MGENWIGRRPSGGEFKTAEEWHGPKEYAFDGDETTIVHNDQRADQDPYWIGELQTRSNIKGIEIINRKLGPREQMANYLITILDEKKDPVWEKKFLDSNDPSYRGPEKLSFQVGGEVIGKYIKVQCYANNPRQGRKIISFAEIYVWGNNGYHHLSNEDLFELTSAINPYKLNDEGAIEMRSMIECNNNLFAISEKPYFKQIISQDINTPVKLFDGLSTLYQKKNWSSFISTYEHLINSHNYQIKNYMDVLYANALLQQKEYNKAYNIYLENVNKLKQNELVNLIILSGQQENSLNEKLSNINIDTLLHDYPEASFFLRGSNSVTLDKIIQNIDAKLPSYYIPEIQLSDQFYESFLIELILSNDSRGEILNMGGKEYADGFTLHAQGNQMQFIICNKDKRETTRINANRGGGWWGIPGSNTKNTLKHHIYWNSTDKKLHYMIDGYDVAVVDFEGPLGRKHEPLVIGGDISNHSYGNAKIYSLKIWDKRLQEDQISKLEAYGKPIFELNLNNALKKGRAFNVTIGSDKPTITAEQEIGTNQDSHLSIQNYESDTLLLNNYIVKSTAEYLNGNFDESSKYLKYTFELNHGKNNDHLQYHIASMLLKKINDPQLKAYMSNKQMAKSLNWKLEYILSSLNDNN